jgi:ferric-dicitrate binding protein FerR (iron transport regulator)
VTRVLGTKFLIKAYGDDSPAMVVVRDGKVAVGSRVLTAMQQISVSSTGESGIQPADTTQFAFANGVLHIQDMPLHEAIPVLNRWYDIDIRFNDPSLANRRITIELTAGTFSDLIELFEYSFNMRVARSGRVLTLHPKA